MEYYINSKKIINFNTIIKKLVLDDSKYLEESIQSKASSIEQASSIEHQFHFFANVTFFF